MQLRATRRGWRLSQHGTVLSEVLARPGPTHSVFDVLAAACGLRAQAKRIALLGFGGGGTVAALRALGATATLHAVDLDSTGRDLLTLHGCDWLAPWRWAKADAAAWLTHQRPFEVILDDLSIPVANDVVKPDITWDRLPELVVRQLLPGGLAIFNLLRPARVSWREAVQRVAGGFEAVRVVHLDDFENRIVLAARELPSARAVHTQLHTALKRLGSRQASRFRVRRA